MKKIAIIGTHGTGKSTLSMYLAHQYKLMGCDCKIVQEVARLCPFPLNENFSLEGALWIYHTHRMKELDAQAARCCTVVCDRSCIDSLLYLKNIMPVFPPEAQGIYDAAFYSMNFYEQIVFVEPDMELVPDKVRSNTDLGYQKCIHVLFEQMVNTLPTLCRVLKIKSSDIFAGRVQLNSQGKVIVKNECNGDNCVDCCGDVHCRNSFQFAR